MNKLSAYQKLIQEKIDLSIAEFGEKTPLRDAVEYSLKNGGKRIRPALILFIASRAGQGDAIEAALAVEFFHTASLIADDLPCMDDEMMRREALALHKVYSENTSILATYALIAAGYGKLEKGATNYLMLSSALKKTASTMGMLGATGGQFLDLNHNLLTPTLLLEIIQKKTAALFELAFSLGWLYGGGDIVKLPDIERAAHHFGIAFQLYDDLQDKEEDSLKQKVNTASILGVQETEKLLYKEIEECKKWLLPELKELTLFLHGS